MSKPNPATFKKITYREQMGFIPQLQGWVNTQKSITIICHVNITRQNHTIVLTDAENVFDKIQ